MLSIIVKDKNNIDLNCLKRKNIQVIFLDNYINKNCIKNDYVIFIDDFYISDKKIELILEKISQNNLYDILLFNKNNNLFLNPYIEYHDLKMSGEEFFNIVIEENYPEIAVEDSFDNNFFIRVIKKDILLKLDTNNLSIIFNDLSVFLEANYIKYLNLDLSRQEILDRKFDYLQKDNFEYLYTSLCLKVKCFTKIRTIKNIEIYIKLIISRYIYESKCDYNYISNILGNEYLDDIFIDININSKPLYYNRDLSKRKIDRYKIGITNIYYIDINNNDKDLVLVKDEVKKNPDKKHILILEDSKKYTYDYDYFDEIYEFDKINIQTKKYVFVYKIFGLKYMKLNENIITNIYIYSKDKLISYTIKKSSEYRIDNIFDNDRFSNSIKIKEFCGYNDINYSHMEHSLYVGSSVSLEHIDSIYPTCMVFGSYRYNACRTRITRPIFKIGPYINYSEDYIHEFWNEMITSIFGKVLLVMPGHTSNKSTYSEGVIKSLIDYIDNIKRKYDTIILAGFHDDIHKGNCKLYQDEGWIVVSSGHVNNEFFYNRLKTIINLSDYVISNKVGTHIGYCAFLNKPITLFKNSNTKITFDSSVKDDKNKENFNNIDINFRREEEVFYELFKGYNKEITSNQYNVCNIYYGFKEIKTKEEMKFILEFSKEMYVKCNNDVLNIYNNKKLSNVDKKIEIDRIYDEYIKVYIKNNSDNKYMYLLEESICNLLNYT